MKKYTLLFSLLLLFSCTFQEELESSTDASVQTVNLPEKFIITQDPDRTINNIRVGENLLFNVEIINFDTNPNVSYVIKPLSIEQKKHQIKNVDYYFQQQTSNTTYPYETVENMVIKSNKSKFYLQILKPGNFQHVYSLQKMVNGEKVGNPLYYDVLFSAVSLNLWVTQQQWCFFGFNCEFGRTFRMIIDDGDEQYDDYLTSENGKSHTYTTNHDGEILDGGFINVLEEKPFSIYHRAKINNMPHRGGTTVREVKITQTLSNGNINIISYKNVVFTHPGFSL